MNRFSMPALYDLSSSDLLLTLLPFLVAGLAVLLVTPFVIALAKMNNWVVAPREDRWHAKPTALMGGISMYAAFSMAVWMFVPSGSFFWVWAGASLLFFVGLMDDLNEMRPATKLVAQIGATTMLIGSGLTFGGDWPFWMAIPFTYIWVIGITNAVNMLDNMDGLAAGIVAIASAIMGFFSLLFGHIPLAGIAFALAGASGGFLFFNFQPARIFMGDSGSLFLGFLLACTGVMVHSEFASTGVLGVLLVPIVVTGVPIFDTSLVTFSRIVAGRPVSQGGRDHSSHRLVLLGLSERNSVLLLYAISLVLGGVAIGLYFVEIYLGLLIAVLAGVVLVAFGGYLASQRVYQTTKRPLWMTVDGFWARTPIIKALLRNRAQFLVITSDLILVMAAFLLAHYLRFEDQLSLEHKDRLAVSLPFFAVTKIIVYYTFRLYHGIWRYAGTAEMIRIIWGTTIGTAAVTAIGFLFLGYTSLSLFVIDAVLAFFLVSGVRFAYRGLHQTVSLRRRGRKRVLLYGAGDGGVFAIRELRQNVKYHHVLPVGFLDDDSMKSGRIVQNLEILGSEADMLKICQDHAVDALLITTPKMPADRLDRVFRNCHRIGVDCHRFEISFGKITAETLNEPSASRVPDSGQRETNSEDGIPDVTGLPVSNP